MKIIKTPNSILSQKAKPVKKIDKNIRRIIQEMKKTLANIPIGVGLAAPQIGFCRQIFLTISPKALKDSKYPKKYSVFINPKIIEKSKEKTKGVPKRKNPLEGCLSIPNIWGRVKRAKKIKLKFLDEKGKTHQRKFTGFTATIIQHELDHLKGVLFTEHVLAQKSKLYKQIKDKKTKEVVMKEIEV